MKNWLKFNDFIQEKAYSKNEIARLVKQGEIEAKNIRGELYLRMTPKQSPAMSVVPDVLPRVEQNNLQATPATPISQTTTISSSTTFSTDPHLAPMEKIFDLHTKCLDAKDEVISAYKQENEFLKKTLLGMQEIYMQDRKMVEFLREELEKNQEELEAFKKKYRLMWTKVANFDPQK